jgi:hypothetical protein
MEDEEKFSADESENLRIENELLRIKLKAQYGEGFQMDSVEDLPPEIENQFLRNIIEIEEANTENERTTVYEKLGKPAFLKYDEMRPEEIPAALARLQDLMKDKQFFLDICDGPYPDITIYRFITEELFNKEVDVTLIFGGGWHFIYEEFHPNNKSDIEENTHEFFRNWINAGFNEFSSELDYHFITADGRQLNREEFFKMIKNFFDSFQQFSNDGYNIYTIEFTEMEDGSAMGFSEGMYKYDAVLENAETIHLEGPYKLYMKRQDNNWSIFYFVMPGFSW